MFLFSHISFGLIIFLICCGLPIIASHSIFFSCFFFYSNAEKLFIFKLNKQISCFSYAVLKKKYKKVSSKMCEGEKKLPQRKRNKKFNI